MMPSGHKAFVVSNVRDVELLLMHNKVYAAEYVYSSPSEFLDEIGEADRASGTLGSKEKQ